MKRSSLYSMVGALLLGSGCASIRKDAVVTVTPLTTLTADTASRVQLDLNFCIPERTLSTRHRLILVPQLVAEDSVWTEYPAVAVDAPVYARKMHRKLVLEGYQDTLADQAVRINRRQAYQLPYRQWVTLPKGFTGGKIVAQISSDGCGECGWVQQVDMAYLSSIPELLERPEEAVPPRWIEPKFVIRPKIREAQGEALLQFNINSYAIDLNLGRNRSELETMSDILGRIVNDTLATLHRVKIEGMASADGSLLYNTRLANNRADAAKRWIIAKLNLGANYTNLFEVGSRPEGWEPILAAMQADGHPDTLQMAEILRKHVGQNDDVAEPFIRNLTCWNDIKQHYLQRDRKVHYTYHYAFRSFTKDAELLDLYHKRPDAFNEEELLRVATLKENDADKMDVYRTLLRYYPESAVAANNLAVLLLRKGRADEAEQVLKQLPAYTPEVIHTLAAVYSSQRRYELAAELLAVKKDDSDMRYFLGMVRAQQRHWTDAFELLRDFNDVNAAVVSLSVNQTETAQRQMETCEDQSPRAAYVRAVIYARNGQKKQMLEQLQQAVTKEALRRRILDDYEFIQYQTDKTFRTIAEGGWQG